MKMENDREKRISRAEASRSRGLISGSSDQSDPVMGLSRASLNNSRSANVLA